MVFLWHEDEPVVPVGSDIDGGAAQSVLEGFRLGDQVGNPLYAVIDEHMLALVALLVFPLLAWGAVKLLRMLAVGNRLWAQRLLEGYGVLPTPRRLAVWLMVASAWVHLALMFGHELSLYTALYLVGAVMLGAAARWVLLGRRPRLTAALLVIAVTAFWFLGAPPDQLGLATKLLELLALALLVVPGPATRRRFGPAGVVSLIVATGVAAWIGAFASAGEDGGHHGGEYPEPGTVVPYIDRLEATHAEEEAADELYWATVAAVEKYQDPAVAEAAGYDVGVIRGTDHHAQNQAYLNDGRIFDPERPESIIYAQSPSGPVLVGVMFETDGIGHAGPTIGGPLTLWHSHENVCFSLTPPALTGLLSPFGTCPAGSINLPITNEMIHAWVLPGVEEQWGHIEEAWLSEYLNGLAS